MMQIARGQDVSVRGAGFGVFAECYQCKAPAPKLHAPALAPHAGHNFTAGAHLAPAFAPYSVAGSPFSSPLG